SNAAKEVRDQAQSAAARRAALLQSLQQALGGPVKSWRARLSVLASAAGDDQSPALSLEGPTEAQRELDQCARRLAAECDQLGEQERALATHLAALSEQLAAAR
ncbi:MAG TPA: hypothetical protein VLJ58_20525, partial [Ramlibacter sp.]|nr:hypothetical protein [Ramlibacter sp.]